MVTSTILSRRWPATTRSLPDARHATTDALTQAGGVNDQLLAAIALAVSEAFGNAVLHAYPGTVGDVDLTIDYDDPDVSITVSDTGVGINRPTQEPGLGLGLQLIAALTTTRTISPTPRNHAHHALNSNPEPPSPEHTRTSTATPDAGLAKAFTAQSPIVLGVSGATARTAATWAFLGRERRSDRPAEDTTAKPSNRR